MASMSLFLCLPGRVVKGRKCSPFLVPLKVTGQVQDLQSSIEWERLSAELRCRQLDSQLSRERSEASKNQEMAMRMGLWWDESKESIRTKDNSLSHG